MVKKKSNKIHSYKNKSRKIGKKSRKRKSKKDHLKTDDIIDVPLSNKISLGTFETEGDKNYHYQAYNNIYSYFGQILKQDKNLAKILCFPDNKNEWMNTFIKVNLDDKNINSSELVIQNISLVGPEENLNKILDLVRSCENKGHKFFVITVMLVVPGKPGSHANILILDLKEKTIELFEPHGKRTEMTTMDSLEGAYKISDNLLKKMFSKILPKYSYISPQNYLPTYGLQWRIDSYTGLCVSWTMLYIHYRILNPNIERKRLVQYMNTFTKKFILRYVKQVEETIKNTKFENN